MSLITCPECAHEVSATATACPNCGHPFAPPVVHRRVVVAETPRDDFPKWIFIPLGLLGVVLLFVLFAFMRNGDDTANNRNISVSVNTQRPAGAPLANSSTTTTSVAPAAQTVVVPPSSTTTVTSSAAPPPSSAPLPSSQTSVPSVPGSTIAAPAPDKGTVSLEAKISTKTGSIQPVKAERFFLLDEDLQTILSAAEIDDETGQGVVNAYGLSVLYPDKYADTRNKALAAINKHIKYRTQTDASGKASMKDVKPDNYYLFGITKTKTGFAVWSAPVSINAGENVLNLSPAQLTEVTQ